MSKGTVSTRQPVREPRVRRGYFECRYGQLHVHNAIPPGGGFEEGTALLCVHGAGQTGRAFQRVLPVIGRDRSVYAPDLPGCGESDGPAARASASDVAAALGDFLDTMRFRHIDVLGFHSGCLIAAELAIARPQQVRRVVLMGIPSGAEVERLRQIGQPLLVARARDETWESTGRAREFLPRARVLDLPQQGAGVLETAADVLVPPLREFLGH
ncbi:MAG: alpha/beta fold hydrolase [Steroidobacteraceae bacterium]|jgi:pimeloyl-ACP methyl ester carboxylesterase|nr:alpha/beta fold hydrolase [Steroidobacteraceae bacterium]